MLTRSSIVHLRPTIILSGSAPSKSRLKQVVAGRMAHDRLLEQLAEEYDNSPLQTSESGARGRLRRRRVIGHLLLLLVVASIGVDDVPQSDLAQRADQKLLHAVVKQRRHFDEFAVPLRRHIFTVCTTRQCMSYNSVFVVNRNARADWAAWQPGICQVGRLVCQPGGRYIKC